MDSLVAVQVLTVNCSKFLMITLMKNKIFLSDIGMEIDLSNENLSVKIRKQIIGQFEKRCSDNR